MSTSTAELEPNVYLLRCVNANAEGISLEESYATGVESNHPVVVKTRDADCGEQLWILDKGNTAGTETWRFVGLGGDGYDTCKAKVAAGAALPDLSIFYGPDIIASGFKFEGNKIENGTVIKFDTLYSNFTVQPRGNNLYSITPFKEDDFFHIGIEYYLGVSDDGKSEVVVKEVKTESPRNTSAIPLWEFKLPVW